MEDKYSSKLLFLSMCVVCMRVYMWEVCIDIQAQG